MKKCLIFLSVIFLIVSSNAGAIPSNALPNGGSVVAGNATITQTSNHMQINQQSQKAIINWKSFNIGSQASTHFQQPAQGIILNRINPSQGASQIFGRLTATGKIILVNQAGIYFGPGAYVNVGGIIASTSDISNENFLSGNYAFDKPSTQNGAIVNQGTIIAKENGLVALIGNGVSNEGLIEARRGNVVLASGNKFTVSFRGDQLINFTIDEGSSSVAMDANSNKLKNGVNNSGRILADGGRVIMTAKTARSVVDHAINMDGIIEARSIAEQNGVIILGGDDGSVVVAGKIDVSGTKGGVVKVLAKDIQVTQSAKISADGKNGGGTILIGGNKQGKGPERNAKKTVVEEGAILSANATDLGNGGNIIVWSDDNTQFHGQASAMGGENGGNGGFIETSGHYLDTTHAIVNTAAAMGTKGIWLLDPTSIYIANDQVNATAAGMSTIDTTANAATGTYPTTYNASGNTNDSLLLVSTLETALANNNVVVTTNNTSGSGTGDITVVDPITWSSANSLTLSAYRNINLNSDISNTTSSAAAVTLQTDNTGTGTGTVLSTGGAVTMVGGSSQVSIYYNPTNYTSPTASFYTGGTTPTSYMLVNALGNSTDAATVKSLGAISNNSSLWGRNYALGTNIDASATSGWNSGAGFTPIGNFANRFTGLFDGQGYTIDGLYQNVTTTIGSDIGLFGNTGYTAVIKNLGVTNANIHATNTDNLNVGVIVGGNIGLIDNSYSTGTITLSSNNLNHRAGGLVGQNSDNVAGTISNSYSTVNLNDTSTGSGLGFSVMGGLVGFNRANGIITSSYATGDINATIASGTIVLAFEGGLIGENSGTVTNSYSIGNVNLSGGGSSLTTNVGGFVGSNPGTINTSYSTGTTTSNQGNLGGFAGSNSNLITNSFWDTDTSGLSTGMGQNTGSATLTGGCFSGVCSNGGTANLSVSSTYSNAGWNIGAPASGTTWQIVDNVIYPHLISEGLHTITGTVYSDNGVTPVGSGVTVNLVENGGSAITTTTNNSGQYSYLFSINSGNPVGSGNISMGTDILIYPSTASTGNVIFQDNGQNATANILNNQIIAGVSGGNAASNTILATALGGLSIPGYSVSGNNIILGSGMNFQNSSNYIFDGNLNTTNGNIVLNTPIITLAAPTITLSTNVGDISITGDLNGTGKTLALQGLAANADTFTLNNSTNALQSLTVSGGSSATTLSVQNNLLTQNWTVNGSQGGTITGITGISSFTFSNIGNLIGGNDLTASNTTNTWTLTGSNTGSLNTTSATYNFSGFNTLTGGTSSDDFIDNGNFTGTIDGGTGTNTIDMGTNPTTTTWTINGANQGTGGGLTSFNNIQVINASSSSTNNIFTIQTGGSISSLNGGGFSGNNTLIGPDVDSVWVVNGSGSGSITSPSTINFSGFSNITGGTGANSFTINSGANLDNLNGGGSTNNNNTFNILGGTINTLDGGTGPNNSLTVNSSSPATFDLNSNNSGSISGGATVGHFTNIPNISSTTGGGTLNISSAVGNINIGANTTVVVTSTGNVGTLNGGDSSSYSISGIIGTLNGGSGTNLYTLNDGAAITNLIGGGSSSNNTLTVNTTGSNVWTINSLAGSISGGANANYTNISNLVGSNAGDTFNVSGNLNSITGGSGHDTFLINPTATISNINGGSGTNSLKATSGNSNWTINGASSGALIGSVTTFNNIQNIIGSPDGTANFQFLGAYFMSINGGNTHNINVIDVSVVPQPINIVVGPKTGQFLNTGTLNVNNFIFSAFTNIQSAIGNGGKLTTNPESLLNSIVMTSATSGYIDDPFYFSGFTPVFTAGLQINSNVSNVITGASSSSDLLTTESEAAIVNNAVNDNLVELINNQINTDTNLTESNSFCFK